MIYVSHAASRADVAFDKLAIALTLFIQFAAKPVRLSPSPTCLTCPRPASLWRRYHATASMTRQNYDKRSLRIMHAADFVRAIHADAASGELSDTASMPDVFSEPFIWLRKRPLLPSEVTIGEFTSVSARVARGASVYDCRLTPDYKAGQMLQHEFPLPVLSQSNEEAVAQMQSALHKVRTRSSRCPGSCFTSACAQLGPSIRWRLCNLQTLKFSRPPHRKRPVAKYTNWHRVGQAPSRLLHRRL